LLLRSCGSKRQAFALHDERQRRCTLGVTSGFATAGRRGRAFANLVLPLAATATTALALAHARSRLAIFATSIARFRIEVLVRHPVAKIAAAILLRRVMRRSFYYILL
jgi:hypothetical protein